MKFQPKTGRMTCYFSMFDAINDPTVAFELFGYMESQMKEQSVIYAEGTFTPYDPDTRRGILIEGFDDDPTIFCSYNYPYYQTLLETMGYVKAYDTVSLKAENSPETDKTLKTLSTYFLKHHDVTVDPIDWHQIDRDIEDITKILAIATTELNYQNPPTREDIAKIAKTMRLFVNKKLVLIARETATKEPIGFFLVLPDFNEILKKSRGHIRPFLFLFGRKHIQRARGAMQYIIPRYQDSGLIGLMFKRIYDTFLEIGITKFEAGTILENNTKSSSIFRRFGGKVVKVYRIYGKEITL
jgi:hypothetical protein